MFASTNEIRGTSYKSRIDDPKYQFAGKTGTSQVKRITEAARELDLSTSEIPYNERDHALYIAFGPYKNPRYALSIVIEHGGSGSSAAAPIAKKLFKLIIDRHELRENKLEQNNLKYKCNITHLIHKPTFFQKLKNFDYILLICILLLGLISALSMYSTDGGEILFHSKSHISKFLIFFTMMIFMSFFNIKFWHYFAYLFYVVVLFFLVWASLYGIKASGSQRWINLYFINLQPSELMKIAIIVCLAKYYHRIQLNKVNSFQVMFVALVILILPIMLLITQPDLGTSILIALSGLVVIWLAGINIKYFIYSFIVLLISMPFAIAFLKPYQKLRILTFLNPDRDPLGAGYQIIQSKIAVGSGGLSGKGFLKGTQSYLEFLPEKHTDFILLYLLRSMVF